MVCRINECRINQSLPVQPNQEDGKIQTLNKNDDVDDDGLLKNFWVINELKNSQYWQFALPPKYCPVGEHILHCPWYIPLVGGAIMFTLTSVTHPESSGLTDTTRMGPRGSPHVKRSATPAGHLHSPFTKYRFIKRKKLK